jgi:NhaA family Na+:H+ antiporter
MVFFFGIAAKEITEAMLPGGSLNPIRKAVNPLVATLGGVAGPALVFVGGLWLCYRLGVYTPELHPWSETVRGWGIPTATDIALAWLVARAVYGKGHPAIDFLLLLAIVDDGIGLVIIAVFYGDPVHPPAPQWLGLALLGMGIAYALRRADVRSWPLYICGAGPLAWAGLVLANMHPALALVFVVPFLPAPSPSAVFLHVDPGARVPEPGRNAHGHGSPLQDFEHFTKAFVDFGLFFFAFANAGVAFEAVGPITWLVLGSLVIGKSLGVFSFGALAARLGFPLPAGMQRRDLTMAGLIAGLGLTVALFVATAAFVDPELRGEAKMGALLSGLVGPLAIVLGRVLGIGVAARPAERPADPAATSGSPAPSPGAR